jgi:hypothetical protein
VTNAIVTMYIFTNPFATILLWGILPAPGWLFGTYPSFTPLRNLLQLSTALPLTQEA